MVMDLSDIFHQWLTLLDRYQGLALFLSLLLKSALIVLLAAALNYFLAASSAAFRHLVWLIAILCLLLLPALQSILPTVELPLTLVESAEFEESAGAVLFDKIEASGIAGFVNFLARLAPGLYLGGVLVLLFYLFLGVGRVYAISRRALPLTHGRAHELLTAFAKEKQIEHRSIILKESPYLQSPLSWGLLKPEILLPARGDQWDEEKLKQVFHHELGHIQRLDWLTLIVGRTVCAIFWFNPLVWLAVRKVAEEAEYACDDLVVLATRESTDYASQLLAFARENSGGLKGLIAQAMAATFLGRRVLGILDDKKSRENIDGVLLIRAVIFGFTLAALLASFKLVSEIEELSVGRLWGRLIDISYARDQGDESKGFRLIDNTSLPPPVREDYALERQPERPDVAVPLDFPTLNALISLEKVPVDKAIETGPALEIRPYKLLSNAFPVYPRLARGRGIQGYAVVQYDISPGGEVVNPVIVESEPGSVFDRTSLEAIGLYRYQPQVVNGEPIGVQGLQARFNFQLDPDPG